MRSPREFYRPLAIGAPQPLHDIPVRPSRMIHFFDPSNAKMRDKVPAIAAQVDILLGNLEDAVAIDNKEAAREGFIEVARKTDLGDTQLWTRVNSLDSPWFLDDVARIIGESVQSQATDCDRDCDPGRESESPEPLVRDP